MKLVLGEFGEELEQQLCHCVRENHISPLGPTYQHVENPAGRCLPEHRLGNLKDEFMA